jgi:predicted dehydrogenase
LHKGGKTETFKTSGQEMGYAQELKAFVDCVGGKTVADVSTTEMFSTMDVIFAIEHALATGQSVSPSATRVMST